MICNQKFQGNGRLGCQDAPCDFLFGSNVCNCEVVHARLALASHAATWGPHSLQHVTWEKFLDFFQGLLSSECQRQLAISIGICTWTFKSGCLAWFRFRVSIHHLLGLNWHPFEGPGVQDHYLFWFYGLLLCFCVVVYLFFCWSCFLCCFVFSGQFLGCKWYWYYETSQCCCYNGN